jgi:hypothetical protein
MQTETHSSFIPRTLKTFLRHLLRFDTEISGIEVSGAGLEDAFLALTGGNTAEN